MTYLVGYCFQCGVSVSRYSHHYLRNMSGLPFPSTRMLHNQIKSTISTPRIPAVIAGFELILSLVITLHARPISITYECIYSK